MRGKGIIFPISKREYDISEEEFQKLQEEMKKQEEILSGIFLEAVKQHNGEMIMQLAKAVWYFKDKRYPNFVPQDRERTLLLFLKAIATETKERLSIRQVAQFLDLDKLTPGEKLPVPADGFSSLRRKCKQVGLRLSDSRKTRPE